ncbi:helix-turn-helix domain-containing protein [Listeria newyorkensis]|uniref:helix-turn-helix domain-containing protein n=1 Tax=Listeria newyorkensis TaxID=1497681 RepID=UPI00068F62B7|nr:helix-turn-helix domain-containing protein [Listeria newyorkensis]SQC57449.1 DNA binding domain, excisionase family [Listeria newyorkensis]
MYAVKATKRVIVIRPRKALRAEEAAEFLDIGMSSLYRYARAGIIPGRKIGTDWRFSKLALEKWLDAQVKEEND